jgi:hypothetical protein
MAEIYNEPASEVASGLSSGASSIDTSGEFLQKKRRRNGDGPQKFGRVGASLISPSKKPDCVKRSGPFWNYAMPRSVRKPSFDVAWARYHRRCALWHSARLRLGDETFFANLAAVESGISDQLAREFGPRPT